MDKYEDFCAYFTKIASDPSAIATRITIREFLKARQHIHVCPKCAEIVESVASKADDRDGIYISEN